MVLPSGIYDVKAAAAGFATSAVKACSSVDQGPQSGFTGRRRKSLEVQANALAESSRVGEIYPQSQGRRFASQWPRLCAAGAPQPGSCDLEEAGTSREVKGFRGPARHFGTTSSRTGDNNNYFAERQIAVDRFIEEFENLQHVRCELELWGRNSGSVVNLVTKVRTDLWHGSVYEFFRERCA